MAEKVQIFLSYARSDGVQVEELYQRLSAAGFKPWLDRKDILPGEMFEISIRQAITHSDFFLACLSTNSVNRRGFIQKEIRVALDIWQEKINSDIYVIPVRLEPCEIPYSLSGFQWVDLFGEDREKNWAALLRAIGEGTKRLSKINEKNEPLKSHEVLTQEQPSGRVEYVRSEESINPEPKELAETRKRLRNVPHNLPARHEFIGRNTEKLNVIQTLNFRAPVVIVEGISGIGKTSLALQVAYDCLQNSREPNLLLTPIFEAVVWVSAKASTLFLRDILDGVARALDKQHILTLTDDEKLYEIHNLMRNAQILLILDNFESITDTHIVDFLRNLPEPSKCLVTTRTLALLESIPGARRIPLYGMKFEESVELIGLEFSRAGISQPTDETQSFITELIEVTGGSPLAIQWAVGQMTQKALSITSVIKSIKDAEGNLFENLFANSWSILSPMSQHLLMLMSIFTSASKDALEAASNFPRAVLQEAIGQVNSMRLLESNNKFTDSELRFTIHPLTRAYVTTKMNSSSSFCDDAYNRLHHYFISLLEKSDETAEGFDSVKAEENFTLIDLEIENIQHVAEWNLKHCQLLNFIKTVKALRTYYDNRGYASKAIEYGLKAVAAAKELNDAEALAESLGYDVAWFLHTQGQNEEAEPYAIESLGIYERIGDRFHYGTIMSLCGFIAESLGQTERAIQMLTNAAATLRDCSDKHYQYAHIEMIKGNVSRIQNNIESALEHYKNALKIFESHGPAMGVVTALGSIARTEIESGFIDQAWEDSLSLLDKSCRLRRRKHFAHGLLNLAAVLDMKGDTNNARSLAHDALVIFRWVGDQRRKEVFEKILATEIIDVPSFSPIEVDEIIQKRCAEFIRGREAGKA